MTVEKQAAPSMDAWLAEAKKLPDAHRVGMYLFHSGVVRETARAEVREGQDTPPVRAMKFSYDAQKLNEELAKVRAMEGVYHVRAWLNTGRLDPGDDIMRVLVGGDTRPHTVAALNALVGALKTCCVVEEEIF